MSVSENSDLDVRIPEESVSDEVLDLLRSNKAMILAHLTGRADTGHASERNTAFLLPQHLRGLISAAQVGLLPKQVRTTRGIIPDLNDHVLAYLAQCHTGDREQALTYLDEADACWKNR